MLTLTLSGHGFRDSRQLGDQAFEVLGAASVLLVEQEQPRPGSEGQAGADRRTEGRGRLGQPGPLLPPAR